MPCVRPRNRLATIFLTTVGDIDGDNEGVEVGVLMVFNMKNLDKYWNTTFLFMKNAYQVELTDVGHWVGDVVGLEVGLSVGFAVGLCVGFNVGFLDGWVVGVLVGVCVLRCASFYHKALDWNGLNSRNQRRNSPVARRYAGPAVIPQIASIFVFIQQTCIKIRNAAVLFVGCW